MVGNPGAGVNMIFLGSLNITVGSTPTVYALSNYGSFNTVTQAATDLDINGPGYTGAANPIGGLFTLTVAAAPEPSSMALCGLIACGLGYTRLRRRQAESPEATPAAV